MQDTVYNPYLPKRSTSRAVSSTVSAPQPEPAPKAPVQDVEQAVEVPEPVAAVSEPVTESPAPVVQPPALPQERVVEVPVGTSFEVISWVDGDLSRAQAALSVEEQSDQPRKTLLRELRRITDASPAQ
jgi:hypothetical protein